jgi:hypothetical protein
VGHAAIDDVGVVDAAVGSAAATSSAETSEIVEAGSSGSRSQPGTSVRNITL